ncbi:MAG: hypothetical protein JW924_03415 [Fusobacteriaceae bacterium]|nr:hypothetical protein [Fusobacteriaceae bacterium]
MNLKGAISKRFKGKQKQKMDETLKRMEETRKQDDIWLRDKLQKRINEALEVRKQKLIMIAKLKKQTQNLEDDVIRLNGFVEETSQILKEVPKKEENPQK